MTYSKNSFSHRAAQPQAEGRAAQSLHELRGVYQEESQFPPSLSS
jgi:hypothetical protein